VLATGAIREAKRKTRFHCERDIDTKQTKFFVTADGLNPCGEEQTPGVNAPYDSRSCVCTSCGP
jgi:hypothetical protein